MSGMPLLMLLTPESLTVIGVIILTGLWLYFGWIRPIQKIRDPSVKTKSGHVFLLLLLGICPVLVPILLSAMAARRNANAVAGTSVNAMGPQPVVNQGAVSQMNAGPR
jgi:hypothetical protein